MSTFYFDSRVRSLPPSPISFLPFDCIVVICIIVCRWLDETVVQDDNEWRLTTNMPYILSIVEIK